MKNDQVYADFLEKCPTVQPPRPWCRFAKAENVWRMPFNTKSMLAELTTVHACKNLIRSGVAVGANKFDLNIHPIFCELPHTAVLPLRKMPQMAPFVLVTEAGSTSGRLPLCDAVHDCHVSHGIESCGFLFATFGLQDLIRLRLLGLPAALAHGLEQFSERSLRQFRYAFGFLEKKPPVVPHRLILSGWNVTRFSTAPSEMLDRVIQNLTDCAPCLGIALSNILVWQPTPTELDGIARCLQIGRLEDVVAVILESLENSCTPLAADPAEPHPETDLIECERRLTDALIRPNTNKARRRRRLRDYDRALHEQIIRPMLVQAENEQNLSERNRWRAVAELCRSLYPATAVQRARLVKEIIERGLPSEASLDDLNKVLRNFDTAYKMLKENE